MKPRDELDRALALDDRTERKIAVVAVVTAALDNLGIRPVIVDGVAVEYWTYGEYSTADIDVLTPYLPEIDRRLVGLGFVRQSRHWVLPHTDIFLGHPAARCRATRQLWRSPSLRSDARSC